MQLSDNIRAFRKEYSLTQEQLAQALGLTTGAIYKWEAGLSVPDVGLIMELADLFDTSVDVLLGYKVRSNKQEVAAERLKDFLYRKDERGLAEADKLLIRYPNCFEIVYRSADLYWVFGYMRHDKKLLLRSIELMERACLLISQNTDPEISEVSINFSIAQAYSAIGEDEKAANLFKSNNPRGIHNDFIGCILGTACDCPDEATYYLTRALVRCVSSLVRITIGYFNVYFKKGDFLAAVDILQLTLRFFSELKKPGQNSYLDKTITQFYVYLAQAQVELGNTSEARESLHMAKTLANQFDLAPNYNGDGLRFVSSNKPNAAFDDLGDTATECILSLLKTCKNEMLTALWHEIMGEDQNVHE